MGGFCPSLVLRVGGCPCEDADSFRGIGIFSDHGLCHYVEIIFEMRFAGRCQCDKAGVALGISSSGGELIPSLVGLVFIASGAGRQASGRFHACLRHVCFR